jgi:hypothetical protein
MALESVSLNGQEFPFAVTTDNGDTVDGVILGYNGVAASILTQVPKVDTSEDHSSSNVLVYSDLVTPVTNVDSVSASVDTSAASV